MTIAPRRPYLEDREVNHMNKRVRERQEPLRERYRAVPSEAWITDRARTEGGAEQDPFHGTVIAGEGSQGWRVGLHRAVGGFHDEPNPGDILCAALASGYDTTLRIIAERLRLPVEGLSVEVRGEVDVRGTLAVDRAVPVGFQRLTCRLRVEPGPSVSPEALARLVAAAERACVVLQTLRHGVPVRLQVDGEPAASEVGKAVHGSREVHG
jgi:uncharacterized OsmC-like protein